jgi:hypothetical protein
LQAAADAPAGSLFSLVAAAVGDLEAAFPGLAREAGDGAAGGGVAAGSAGGARGPASLPRPTLAAVERLRAALAAATPHS